jgi:WS/DGAT/MGAT family acyltransferase
VIEIESFAVQNGRHTRPQRLNALDMINLAVETPAAPMTIGAVLVLDRPAAHGGAGGPSVATIRQAVERALVAAPPLRRVIRSAGPLAGRPVWVDDCAFDVDRHVLTARVPWPGDQAQLLRLAAQLMSGPLDRAHPLWRMWLLTGLAGGHVAILVKLHHVLADGLAAIQLVLSTLEGALPETDGPVPRWAPVPAPNWSTLVADNLGARLAAVRQLPRRVGPRRFAGMVRGHWRMIATLRHAARTSLNAPIGPRRRLAVMRVDLAEAKQLAHRHGGKVNDVVLSLATAGVRALLHTRGESLDGLWLHATVAMSLRTSAEALDGGGNRTGGFVVRLPAGEPDPAARLGSIAVESARAKRDQPPTAGNVLLIWLARMGVANYFSRHQRMIHFVESNVPGPPVPVRVLGAPVLDVLPIGNLAGNLGVSFLAVSYAGTLAITVHVDADRFPDLPVLLAGMRREWAMLRAATLRCGGVKVAGRGS